MHVVVDGRTADIQTHMPCIERCEWFFVARQRVVNDEGHGPYSPISIVRSPTARPPKKRVERRLQLHRAVAAPGNRRSDISVVYPMRSFCANARQWKRFSSLPP